MTSPLENLDVLTPQDWVVILNMAMHLGGITEIVVTKENLEAFKADPTTHRYMNVGRLDTGGLVFQLSHVANKTPETFGRKPTLN